MNVPSPRVVWIAILVLALPSVVVGWNELRAEASFWFGWLPVAALSAGAAIAGYRWDRRWLNPRGWMSYALLFAAGIGMLFGALLSLTVVASMAFPFAAFAFFITHREKDTSFRSVDPADTRSGKAKSLAYCAAPLVLLILIPNTALAWISKTVAALTRTMVSGWLAVMEIPSATIGQTIVLFDSAIEMQHLVSGAFSWPMLLAIALSYSALRRLPLLGCALNILLAWLLAVLMLAGNSVTVAYLKASYGEINSGSVLAIQIAWLLSVCVVFMSLQRISHALTAPINSRFLSSQANPLVSSWNLLAGGGRHGRRSAQRAGVGGALPLVVIGVLLAGAVLQVVNFPARSTTETAAVAIDQDSLSQLLGRPVYVGQPLVSTIGSDTFLLERATALHPTTPLSLTVFSGSLDSEAAICEVLSGAGKIEKVDARAAIECSTARIPGKPTLAYIMHAHLDNEGKVVGNEVDSGLSSQRTSAQLVVYSVAADTPNWDQMCEWFTKLINVAVVPVKPPSELEE